MQIKQRKSDLRALYSKKVLRESLLELLKGKNIAQITPTAICRQAGVNRSTFYAHYDSPETLLKSIESDFFEKVTYSISSKDKNIDELFTEICWCIYDNKDLCTVLFSNHGNKELLKEIIEFSYVKTIKSWKEMQLQPMYCSIEMLYCFFVNGTLSVLQKWILDGMIDNPQMVAQFIKKVIYQGREGFLPD